MKLHTYYVPIVREWCTYDLDTYDGAEDAGPQAVGYGKTEAESVAAFHEEAAEVAEYWERRAMAGQ